MAEWLRRLTCKPKVRTAVGSNPALDSLVAVRNSSLGRPVPCEGNLVAAGGSCGRLMVKHAWPLLEISLSDLHRLATLSINTYLPKKCYKHLQQIIKTITRNISCQKLTLLSLEYFLRVVFCQCLGELFSRSCMVAHPKNLYTV